MLRWNFDALKTPNEEYELGRKPSTNVDKPTRSLNLPLLEFEMTTFEVHRSIFGHD